MVYQANSERYDTMKYNRCGNSGLMLPSLSLGLWHNFGFVDEFENQRDIIKFAFDSGITHFDLANNYGPPAGSAETNFGKILNTDLKAYRDELIISSKAGYGMWPGPYGDFGSKKYIIASCDQSLKRLGVEYVDIFYSHRPDPDTPIEETMGALDQLVRQGKALYVGVSNYNAEQTAKAYDVLKALGTPCLIHQPKYNMLDRGPENGLLDVLGDKGMGSIVFSPLEQGILTDRYLKGVPANSRAGRESSIFLSEKDITEQKLKVIRELNDLAQKRGQSLAQMAVAWLLKDKRVTSVLVGASSVNQLQNNIESIKNLNFTSEETNNIETIVKDVKYNC